MIFFPRCEGEGGGSMAKNDLGSGGGRVASILTGIQQIDRSFLNMLLFNFLVKAKQKYRLFRNA
jgi:hypothetical protein